MIDDEQLLTALREAMRAGEAVPSWFAETGKNAYAWHNVDADLAQLTCDSGADAELSAAARSETASIRALTFTSSRLSMDLEVAGGSVLGQIVPLRAGTLETHTNAGVTTAPVDETGCFALDPKPVGPFRLRFWTTDGVDVVTGWITL